MSQTLQFIQAFYNDPSFVALKEWAGPNGEIGVYQSERYRYIYLFVLVNAEQRKYYQQQYAEKAKDAAFLDAEALTAFGGIRGQQQRSVKDLLANALYNDAAHHKQWYLWRIVEVLGLDLSDEWSEEYPKPEPGIAP